MLRQVSEPPHARPHREIGTFDIARADMRRIGIADDFLFAADALSGATALESFWRVAVNFHEL
jgi:hypothetical protein